MVNLIYKLFYAQPLSKIIFLMFMLILSWTWIGLWFAQNQEKEKLWKRVNLLGWLSMVFIIIMVTISSRTTGEVEFQWMMPFALFKEARIQPEIYRSMLMNVFMFLPLGLTMPYALPSNWKCKTLITILFAMALSAGIEFSQYYFQLGRAETDDVICNTLGCIMGTFSYLLKYKGVDYSQASRHN